MCTKTVSRFFPLAELITPMHTKSMYNNSAVQTFFSKINFLSISGSYVERIVATTTLRATDIWFRTQRQSPHCAACGAVASFSHWVRDRILRGFLTARGVLIVTTSPRGSRHAVLSRDCACNDWHDNSIFTEPPPRSARRQRTSCPGRWPPFPELPEHISPLRRDTTRTSQLHPIPTRCGHVRRSVGKMPGTSSEALVPDLREIT